MALQTLLRALYPPQCLLCETWVAAEGGLCPACWREAEFISGPACHQCSQPLPGVADDVDADLTCDDCLGTPRPWGQGRAVMRYAGKGRQLVLALKHGDRTDIAPAAAAWMARRLGDLVQPGTLVVPVPLHWRRRVRRRYNQSALLAQALARQTGMVFVPDALRRPRATRSLDGMGRVARAQELEDAIRVHTPDLFAGARVLIVDDVLTSGATLAACARAVLGAGAACVDVTVLARVAPDL
jgi:ComF family protein